MLIDENSLSNIAVTKWTKCRVPLEGRLYCSRRASTVGSMRAVAAVLLIHIESSQVTNMKPARCSPVEMNKESTFGTEKYILKDKVQNYRKVYLEEKVAIETHRFYRRVGS